MSTSTLPVHEQASKEVVARVGSLDDPSSGLSTDNTKQRLPAAASDMRTRFRHSPGAKPRELEFAATNRIRSTVAWSCSSSTPSSASRPPPPGQNSKAGSTEYPTWRKRVSEIIELRADDLDGPKVTFIEMADAHFRTNSPVVLPEGEDPVKTGAHQALTSFGILSTALRFNEDHPGRTLLVAGHTDTTNTPAFNQPLSEERRCQFPTPSIRTIQSSPRTKAEPRCPRGLILSRRKFG